MNIIYAREPFPTKVRKSLFLAGPTPRDKSIPSWRPQALQTLEKLGFDGHIFVPEGRDGVPHHDYMGQVEWEEEGLHRADCILFWIPRMMDTMPALTTNDEWGAWKASGKVVLGAPETAAKVRYQQYYARKMGVPVADTLDDTILHAMSILREGAEREDGECTIPLILWRAPSFQAWYKAQRNAGNRLDGARVVWKAPLGAKGPFYWGVHANVHVAAEGRNKSNEVVIARPDITQVVLYSHASGVPIEDAKVILVKEFRSPGTMNDGFVRDLPGGSTPDASIDPALVAAEEVEEEVGLKIEPSRLMGRGVCQLAATMSAHKANLFAVRLREDELEWVKSQAGVAKGLHDGTESTERTYAEIWTYGALLKADIVDWTTLGMISRVLHTDAP